MKKICLFLFLFCFLGCRNKVETNLNDKQEINQLLDNWHDAASKADFNRYFDLLSDQSVFIGTDATENWNKKDFMVWSKPYFDKGKAWRFTSLERNIYIDSTVNIAWFDELLNTQMKICRGSGVVSKEGKQWKIMQYVLSMTFPNDNINAVFKIKHRLKI